jgi:hypothetical protein
MADEPGSGTGARRTLLAGGALAVVCGYAWWVTGLVSFTFGAYLGVAVPAAIVGAALARWWRVEEVPVELDRRALAPWGVVVLAGLVLEGIGLALGGHAASVPTLSDVVDELFVPHVVRFAAFLLWIAAAALVVPSRRRAVAAP